MNEEYRIGRIAINYTVDFNEKVTQSIKKLSDILKKAVFNDSDYHQTKSGEKATITYVLDEAKIAEEEKYDGFYAVETNLDAQLLN